MQYFHASHVSCAVSWSSLVAPGFGFGFVASVGGGEGEGGGEGRGGRELMEVEGWKWEGRR